MTTPFCVLCYEGDSGTCFCMPVIKVKIASIIGAADAFTGGFIAARLEQRSTPECLVRAVVATALCVQVLSSQCVAFSGTVLVPSPLPPVLTQSPPLCLHANGHRKTGRRVQCHHSGK